MLIVLVFISMNAQGQIFAVEMEAHRIARVDGMTARNWATFEGNGMTELHIPFAIALDGAGRIYVADSANSRTVRMDDMTGLGWAAFTVSPGDPLSSP